jgi:hypothetical protein
MKNILKDIFTKYSLLDSKNMVNIISDYLFFPHIFTKENAKVFELNYIRETSDEYYENMINNYFIKLGNDLYTMSTDNNHNKQFKINGKKVYCIRNDTEFEKDKIGKEIEYKIENPELIVFIEIRKDIYEMYKIEEVFNEYKFKQKLNYLLNYLKRMNRLKKLKYTNIEINNETISCIENVENRENLNLDKFVISVFNDFMTYD